MNDLAVDIVAVVPTWGSMIREHGYESVWWGKWHLGHDPDTIPGRWQITIRGRHLSVTQRGAGQGVQMDPTIATNSRMLERKQVESPWLLPVSLVNPHDIQCGPDGPDASKRNSTFHAG